VARWDNRCENASPTGSAENEIPMEKSRVVLVRNKDVVDAAGKVQNDLLQRIRICFFA
jgi:hypothetical protein